MATEQTTEHETEATDAVTSDDEYMVPPPDDHPAWEAAEFLVTHADNAVVVASESGFDEDTECLSTMWVNVDGVEDVDAAAEEEYLINALLHLIVQSEQSANLSAATLASSLAASSDIDAEVLYLRLLSSNPENAVHEIKHNSLWSRLKYALLGGTPPEIKFSYRVEITAEEIEFLEDLADDAERDEEESDDTE